MSKVPKAIRLSQHLDLDGQLQVLQLKAKLQEMTEKVQQLLEHMDALEQTPGLFSKPRTDSVATQTSRTDESPGDRSATLRDKMKELADMNLNWQKYNALQEKHVQELNNQVEALHEKLKRQEDDRHLQEHLLKLKEQENFALKTEVEKLRLRMDMLYGNGVISSACQGQPGHMEREQLLEAQILTFKEDFEKERKDRENAQARVAQLEMELRLRMSTWNHFGTSHYETDGELALSQNGAHQHPQEKTRITIQSNGNLAADEADAMTSSNVVLRPHSEKQSPCQQGRSTESTEDILCCPKCYRIYTRREHIELLDHMDECHDV